MIKRTYCLLRDKYLSALFIRFVFGGVGGYLFRILFTYGLTEFFELNYFVFYVIAETVTTLVNFLISMKWVFKLKDHPYQRFVLFTIWTVVFYFVNLALVKSLTDLLGLHYLLAITLVMGTLVILKFPIFDYFVFHKHFKRKKN